MTDERAQSGSENGAAAGQEDAITWLLRQIDETFGTITDEEWAEMNIPDDVAVNYRRYRDAAPPAGHPDDRSERNAGDVRRQARPGRDNPDRPGLHRQQARDRCGDPRQAPLQIRRNDLDFIGRQRLPPKDAWNGGSSAAERSDCPISHFPFPTAGAATPYRTPAALPAAGS